MCELVGLSGRQGPLTYIVISLIGFRDQDHELITALNVRLLRRGGSYSISRRQDEVSRHPASKMTGLVLLATGMYRNAQTELFVVSIRGVQ